MTYTMIFLVALTAYTFMRLWLSLRQRHHLAQHRSQIPEAFQQQLTLSEHQKAIDYSQAKGAINRIDIVLDTLLLLIWTLGGGLQTIHNLVIGIGLGSLSSGTLTVLMVLLISSLAGLPLSLYRTFVIEQRFGFNRTTVYVWLADMGKGIALALVFGVPLILLMLWLVEQAGNTWWLWAWSAFMGFSLFISWAFPTFIAPLFNTFTPLQDEKLNQKIERLLSESGFQSNGVYVIDGSRRSGHGNAYFAGFGRSKRIVFYDTLLETLNPEQVLAVLAHELGHFHHRHVLKNLVLSSLVSLAGFYLLAQLLQSPVFFEQLGVQSVSNANGILLFLILAPVFTFFLNPLTSVLSRRYEFEADRFAASRTRASDLISALLTLYRDNASPLTTDPLHSTFYDSHPPASARIKELQTC